MAEEDSEHQQSRRILMIVSNSGQSPVSGWPVGFWWAELTHPWLTFRDAGYHIDIVSPNGGDLAGDAYSDPEDESGYSADDLISLGFKSSEKHSALLQGTKRLAEANWRDYDAIMVIGGQGPMVLMIDDENLQQFFAQAYEAGKICCAICHGTCILLKTKLSSGKLLVSGKTWTGFADSEERYAEAAAGTKIQPFWIEQEASKIDDTNFIVSGAFQPFAVRDGNLVTGQQQNSGVAAAEKIIEALGK